MMYNYTKLGIKATIIASAVCCSLSSCSDDNNGGSAYSPGNYHYQLNIPNSNDEIFVVLDSISSGVKTIGSCPDWAVATLVDSMDNGHPILRLKLKKGNPNTTNKGDILVMSEMDDRVTLSLNQASLFVNENNSIDEEFYSNWEDVQSVSIYSNGRHQTVKLPWAKTSSTTLPMKVRNDVKKKDGWEMAFSTLNTESLDDCNYFALYNRYLGTLRVFLYVTNSATNGSKYSFEVNMGSTGNNNKYPFYHSLAYAIPSSHTSVPTNTNLLGEGIRTPQTFKSYFSPYTSTSSSVLTRGWTAFDIDMSAYTPSNKSWIDSGDEMSIFCKSEQTQSITLDGSISANISGKYSSAEQTASASSGVSSMLSMAGGVIGDVQNSALAAIEAQLTGSKLDTYFYYIGAACNVAAFAYDYLMENKYEEHVVDSMPGKIEMSMTGDINMSGYINSLASNSITPLTFGVDQFKSYNSHMGQGVWNLSEDPVIYMVNDRIMGDVGRFNMTVNSDKTYKNNSIDDYHLRMITFFDPNSIKLNINTDVFPDVSDVKVYCDYGVYPDVNAGHTSSYAKLLKLDRPKLDIVKSDETQTIYQSASSKNKTKYLNLAHTSFMSKQLGETKDKCKLVAQKGANYYYYGLPVANEGKKFIISPQVYIPYKKSESKVYNGETPDFVVLVNVSFKSNGRTYIFSQRFLPKVVSISANDLRAKYNDLVSYSDKCKKNQAINNLQNNSSVGVKHIGGDGSVQKSIDILKAVLK